MKKNGINLEEIPIKERHLSLKSKRVEKEQKPEEAKGSNRLAHLREIELSRQKAWKENHVFEADAEEDWPSKYDFETKNKKKYLITFPVGSFP